MGPGERGASKLVRAVARSEVALEHLATGAPTVEGHHTMARDT